MVSDKINKRTLRDWIATQFVIGEEAEKLLAA